MIWKNRKRKEKATRKKETEKKKPQENKKQKRKSHKKKRNNYSKEKDEKKRIIVEMKIWTNKNKTLGIGKEKRYPPNSLKRWRWRCKQNGLGWSSEQTLIEKFRFWLKRNN